MPKILATEIRGENLLEWNKSLRTGLKYYHIDVDGRGGAYENMERA